MNPENLPSAADRQHALRAETASSPGGKRKRIGRRKRTPEELKLARGREPELYKRLDELSRLPLKGYEAIWGKLVEDIGGGRYYEHLPLLVAIVHDGKWRTNAFHLKSWLLTAWRYQVRKVQPADDYDEFGKRRPGGPKFDDRNGALLGIVMRPVTEYAITDKDGEEISGEDAVELHLARVALSRRGSDNGYYAPPGPATRENLRFLGGLTRAERHEHISYEQMLDALKHNRPIFDAELRAVMLRQQPLMQELGLSQDESRVMAILTILWAGEARTYLRFLEGAEKKLIRNAWDRLDLRCKNEEFAARLRQVLRQEALRQRARWDAVAGEYESPAEDVRFRFQAVPTREENPKINHVKRSKPRMHWWKVSTGLAMSLHRLRSADLMSPLPTPLITLSDEDAHEGSRVVDLGCDLDVKQQVLYISSAAKTKSRRTGKLYSD